MPATTRRGRAIIAAEPLESRRLFSDATGVAADGTAALTPVPALPAPALERPDNGGGPGGGCPAADDLLRVDQLLRQRGGAAGTAGGAGAAVEAISIVIKSDKMTAFFHS